MGVVKDVYDVGQEILSSVKNAIKAVRRIPVLDDFVGRLEKRFLNPIVVHRVTDPDPKNADLLSALELYERRIPDKQRFESADIIRWLREDRERRRARLPSRDYFLIAKFRKKVCGLSLFHFYGTRSLVFFAYLVAAKGPGTPAGISESLISRIAKISRKKPLQRCKGWVLELEDPKRGSTSEKNHSLARIRLFSKLAEVCGFTLRAVDIPYLQPPLSHWPQDSQEQLLLMYAYPVEKAPSSIMSKAELKNLLEFIYLELYPDGYSSDAEENEHYRLLCKEALDRLTGQLPDTVRMLRLSDLRLRINNAHS
jgi:hypothetical protein